VARAKIWLDLYEHFGNRVQLKAGEEIAIKVSYSGDRLWVNSDRGTAIHGHLVGIEWHERMGDEYGPGRNVGSTEDQLPQADDYSFELTVATNDWLPHG